MALTPQALLVLRHMVKTGSISNVEAHAVLKVRSVSRRITEIQRNTGVIVDKTIKQDSQGQRYTRYSLTPSEAAWASNYALGTLV